MSMLAIGIDAGGTATRTLARTVDGRCVGTASGGGANPNSHPPDVAAARVAELAGRALGEHSPASVGSAVLGLAGDSKLVDPEVAAMFQRAWQATGIACELVVRSDVETAFASATTAPAGTALVAGTGSIAVGVAEHRMARLAGGYGWLLGDEGSGFWLGREAVRCCLDQLLGDGELGALARAVYEHAVGAYAPCAEFAERRAQSSRVVTAANADSPVRLARFAPLVSQAAVDGDPAAARILDVGAEHLVGLVGAVHQGGPVVLTGGLVGPGGPLTERLLARLGEVTGERVELAGDGVTGAAWLAARALDADAPHAVTR